MNFAGIIAWLIANVSTIVQVLQTVDSIAVTLIKAHGNSPQDAYLKAAAASFSSFAPKTSPAEDLTIGRQLQAP